MEKSTKTTLTIVSVFLLFGGAFFIYATGRLEDMLGKIKGEPKKDDNAEQKETGLITPIKDFPLRKGKLSSKAKVKILQKWINFKIWAITMSNAKFIDEDGIYGDETYKMLVKFLGQDPTITAKKWESMQKYVVSMEQKQKQGGRASANI